MKTVDIFIYLLDNIINPSYEVFSVSLLCVEQKVNIHYLHKLQLSNSRPDLVRPIASTGNEIYLLS